MLTIVMYHYVRDLPRTRFPGIKGLLTDHFEGQLDYISKTYSVCTLADVIAASRGQAELPHNACVLTFDDGLADHYQTVVPRLLDRGFKGAFFPSARPLEDHCVLEVHRIQFVLAATDDHTQLARELLNQVEPFRGSFAIPNEKELRERFESPNRFDPPETAFVKKMLQWVLPESVRSAVTTKLFQEYVSNDERGFAQELYMDISQLRAMLSAGMEIGGHGYNHRWLGKLSSNEQADEIQRTVNLLGSVAGRAPADWVMCYPFGSYNSETLQLVAGKGCACGVTTKVGLANISSPLELARFDTNDLPTSATANVSIGSAVVG
jgi:peptidoglycan/xylan/chitin deacetylase (PgdA/CDA1 family)